MHDTEDDYFYITQRAYGLPVRSALNVTGEVVSGETTGPEIDKLYFTPRETLNDYVLRLVGKEDRGKVG